MIPVAKTEKQFFRCDPLSATISVDQCAVNRALPAGMESGPKPKSGIHRPGPCTDCSLARSLDAGEVPVLALADVLGGAAPAPPEPARKPPPKPRRERKAAPPLAPPLPADGGGVRPRLYSRAEIEILRRDYPAGDIGALADALGRSRVSLHCKASALRIHRTAPRVGTKAKWIPTPEIDAAITRVYQQPQRKNGLIDGLAQRIRWPRWKVSARARALGVVSLRTKEPNWRDRELELLEKWGHHSPFVIRLKLKKLGYDRSVTGIVLKRNRMRLTAPYLTHGYTANRLADAFGVDGTVIAAWIGKGWLHAQRRGTARTPQQGGDMWWIKTGDVRRFILDSVEVIDLAKVDKTWFVEVLGRAGA